jgi:prolyl oligopeptidase
MLEKKQNVFDDFIAASEYLIREGYTSADHLAIAGGSNGGLLVGACLTQRPELYCATFPMVGVLDMLRYHRFTIGWGGVVEYGSADNAADFPYLYAYSPLHNIKQGVCYPPTLITTADHDDRVVPAHSFKFGATLQAAQSANGEGCDDPILVRIESEAGHGAGKPISKTIQEQADIWSFFLWNAGVRDLK